MNEGKSFYKKEGIFIFFSFSFLYISSCFLKGTNFIRLFKFKISKNKKLNEKVRI